MVSMCGEDTARSAEGALPTALLSWAGRLWGGAGQLGHRPSGLLPIPQGSPQTPLCPDSSRLVSGAPATLIDPPALASCFPLASKGGTSSLAEREGVPPLGGLWVSPASSLSPFSPPCILHLSLPRIPPPTFPPRTTGDGKDPETEDSRVSLRYCCSHPRAGACCCGCQDFGARADGGGQPLWWEEASARVWPASRFRFATRRSTGEPRSSPRRTSQHLCVPV